ncbi:MAG: MetQ/NlpA family ABC transporter substrate-binding protein, partial [Plesiomonas shigelloides]
MTLKFKTLALVSALAGSLLLTACGQKEADSNKIKVGVISGAEEQVAEVAKKVAKQQYGLDVELVSFSDYITPNAALADGSLDVNAFQHKPYLDQQIADRGYKLAVVGNSFVYP